MENYIVVIGSLNCDLIFRQDRLPNIGETFLAKDVTICAGGKGANQATQCAKLTAKTYMIGKVGSDFFGDYLKSTIAGWGVDTTCVLNCGCTTGVAGVNAMENGLYYSTVAPGANHELRIDDVKNLTGLIQNAKVLIMQMEIPLSVIQFAIDIAYESGVFIILNAAPANELPPMTLKKVDCLLVNEVEAAFYAKREINSIEDANKSASELLKQVKKSVIITLGKNGSVLCNSNGCKHFKANKEIIAVETTGSGDSYISGFAYMKFLDYSDETACAFASHVAEKTITRVGAQESMPTLTEVMDVFQKLTEEAK